MNYESFLNRVFNHLKIIGEKGTPGIAKKMSTLSTLIENKCAEGKVETMSQNSELIVAQDKLNMEMAELRMALDIKKAKIQMFLRSFIPEPLPS